MRLKAKFNILACPNPMYKDLIAKTHHIKVQYKEFVFQWETLFLAQDFERQKYNKV